MLVLSRKTEQVICVGSDVEITVLGVQGNRVRLGIEAPRDVRIRRGELEAFDPPDESCSHARARAETVA
jgi:carbon storage regulator